MRGPALRAARCAASSARDTAGSVHQINSMFRFICFVDLIQSSLSPCGVLRAAGARVFHGQRVCKRIEVHEALRIVTQAQQHLGFFHLLSLIASSTGALSCRALARTIKRNVRRARRADPVRSSTCGSGGSSAPPAHLQARTVPRSEFATRTSDCVSNTMVMRLPRRSSKSACAEDGSSEACSPSAAPSVQAADLFRIAPGISCSRPF